MSEQEVFAVVKKVVLEVLPFLGEGDVEIDKSLKDLGANSIDRMEVVTGSLEELNVQIPLTEFGKVKNLRGLVEVLRAHA
jgi:polyketide biosynthesis acyl carrier protein